MPDSTRCCAPDVAALCAVKMRLSVSYPKLCAQERSGIDFVAAHRGWMSESSHLRMWRGELFFLTSPFIEPALYRLKTQRENTK